VDVEKTIKAKAVPMKVLFNKLALYRFIKELEEEEYNVVYAYEGKNEDTTVAPTIVIITYAEWARILEQLRGLV